MLSLLTTVFSPSTFLPELEELDVPFRAAEGSGEAWDSSGDKKRKWHFPVKDTGRCVRGAGPKFDVVLSSSWADRCFSVERCTALSLCSLMCGRSPCVLRGYVRGTWPPIAYSGSCAAKEASAISAAGMSPSKSTAYVCDGSGDVMCHIFFKILLLGGDWGKDVVGMWPWRSWDLWNLSQAAFGVTVVWMWGGGTGN